MRLASNNSLQEMTMADSIQNSTSFLRRKDVEVRTGLSRSTIYARIRAGTFPAPISLGARAVGWIEADVQRWISERISSGWSADRRMQEGTRA
jgi:prophage regulatory protein